MYFADNFQNRSQIVFAIAFSICGRINCDDIQMKMQIGLEYRLHFSFTQTYSQISTGSLFAVAFPHVLGVTTLSYRDRYSDCPVYFLGIAYRACQNSNGNHNSLCIRISDAWHRNTSITVGTGTILWDVFVFVRDVFTICYENSLQNTSVDSAVAFPIVQSKA